MSTSLTKDLIISPLSGSGEGHTVYFYRRLNPLCKPKANSLKVKLSFTLHPSSLSNPLCVCLSIYVSLYSIHTSIYVTIDVSIYLSVFLTVLIIFIYHSASLLCDFVLSCILSYHIVLYCLLTDLHLALHIKLSLIESSQIKSNSALRHLHDSSWLNSSECTFLPVHWWTAYHVSTTRQADFNPVSMPFSLLHTLSLLSLHYLSLPFFVRSLSLPDWDLKRRMRR